MCSIELGLHAVPKTSGASGLHIVLPLGQRVPNDAARMIAEIVATPCRRALSEDRDGRALGAARVRRARSTSTICRTFAARPSPASIPCARSRRRRVSTPLAWSEVNDDLDPTAFTIDTVPTALATRRRPVGEGDAPAQFADGRSRVPKPATSDAGATDALTKFLAYLAAIELAVLAHASRCRSRRCCASGRRHTCRARCVRNCSCSRVVARQFARAGPVSPLSASDASTGRGRRGAADRADRAALDAPARRGRDPPPGAR